MNVNGSLSTDTVVNYQIQGVQVAGGTATPVADLGVLNGTVTIPAGSTTGTITLTPSDDQVTEGYEGFKVVLLDSNFNEITTSGNVVIQDPANAGQTFVLTTGVDAAPDFTGGVGDDIFRADYDAQAQAATHTLSALDELDGGAGNDIFRITSDGAAFVLRGSTIANIETMTIAGSAAVTADVSGTNVTGLESLTISRAGGDVAITADSSQDVTVSNLVNADAAGANTVADIAVTGGNSVTITHAGIDTAEDGITVDGAGDVTLTLTKSSQLDDVNGGAANTGVVIGGTTANTGAINITASGETVDATTNTSADLQTLTGIAVTGGTTITVTQNASADGSFVVTDDTGTTTMIQGAVTVTGSTDTTSVTVIQDEEVTAVQARKAVAGVAETITVTFGEMTSGETMIVNGLTFTATRDLTAAQVADAFANMSPSKTVAELQADGGITANGFYTGNMPANSYTSGAATHGATTSTVTFTEVTAGRANGTLGLGGTAAIAATESAATTSTAAVTARDGVMGVANGLVSIQDNATAASITTVHVDGYGAGANLGTTNNLNAITDLYLANSDTGGVNFDSTVTTLNLTVNDVDGAVDLGGNLTSLNVTTETTDSVFASMAAAGLTTLSVDGDAKLTTTSNLAALTTVTVSGSAGLTLAAANSASLTSINASATSGNVTATIDAGAATYTGGSGVDTVTTVTTTAPTKAITLGAGNDKITLASGTTAMGSGGTIDGGADTDTLSMVAADAVTASGSTVFATHVTNFEVLELTGATGSEEVEADALGFNNIKVVDAAAGNALTLDGITSGATITIANSANSAITTSNVIAMVTDADLVANDSDVLNINISASGEDGTADENGVVTAADVETININVTDVTAVQTPTDTPADAQNLTLAAVDAETITIIGDTALNLSTATNQLVTTIDASAMTGALTVTAAGGVASTITGGSGNDSLTASSGTGGALVDNATGSNAVIANDAVAGVTAAYNTYTLDLTGLVLNENGGTGDTLTFTVNGDAVVAFTATQDDDTAGSSITDAKTALVGTQITIDSVVYDITDAGGASLTLTATTAATYDHDLVMSTQDASTDGAKVDPTTATAVGAPDGVTAVQEQVTVTLTDGTNTGLTLGDTMALTVGGTTYTYTATAPTVTMDVAAAGLTALIDAGTHSAAYDAGTNTITITAATATATDLSVTGYTITDATSDSAQGDTLIGGDGNDTLVAGNLATLTGGAGNDKFVMTVPTNVNSYSTIADLSSGDTIDIDITDAGNLVFASAAVSLGSTAVFQDYANAVINQLDADGDNVGWFQYDGNTYIAVSDGAGADFVNGSDAIIQIAGLVDLDTEASYNQTAGLIEIA